MDIVGAKAKVRVLERLPIAAELEHGATIGIEVRVAAGDGVDQHRLARGEVENSGAGRFEHWVAELIDGRRPLFTRPAGEEVQAVHRRPVGAGAELGQRAEVRKPVDLGIAVERQIAERAEIRLRREIGRSTLTPRAAGAAERSRSDAPSGSRSLSRCIVLAAERDAWRWRCRPEA